MKHMKKLTSILLALVMALGLATTALAVNVTIAGTEKDGILEGHTFVAYQVFQGDEADGVLSNVVWGDNISSNSGEFLAALKTSDTFMVKDTSEGAAEDAKVNAFANCETAADVAEAMGQFKTGTDAAKEIAKLAYTYKSGDPFQLENGKPNTLADGYYLIVDVTATEGKDDVKNAALLQVVGDEIEIAVKTDAVSFEKKVKDVNDSTGEVTKDKDSEWIDSADYDINDNVPFQLKATLPNNVADYATYKVVFHDTLSDGLDFNNDVVIKIDGKVVYSKGTNEPEEITVTPGEHTFTIACNDVKKLGAGNESVITVEYTAKLNDGAVIGTPGNPNTAYLEYSNNPNETTGMGKTVEDKVIVFTYKTVIDKVDPDGNALAGAAFKLEKFVLDSNGLVELKVSGTQTLNGRWDEIKDFGDTSIFDSKKTQFTFEGLDDGYYRLSETKTPAGYNTMDDVYFVIEAEHEVEDADPGANTLTSFNVYKTNAEGVVMTEDGTGTKVNWGTAVSGTVTTEIVNNSGTKLPETGGIGTTIFYIVGGVLAVGAVVLLVTKKRMDAKD